MLLISHRGNLVGPGPATENHPEIILKILDVYPSLFCEVDVRLIHGDLWLGHDLPEYKVPDSFEVYASRIFWHAKNFEAFQFLDSKGYTTFMHDKDLMALTTSGWVWTSNDLAKSLSSIKVALSLKDTQDSYVQAWGGICSDWIYSLMQMERTNTL